MKATLIAAALLAMSATAGLAEETTVIHRDSPPAASSVTVEKHESGTANFGGGSATVEHRAETEEIYRRLLARAAELAGVTG